MNVFPNNNFWLYCHWLHRHQFSAAYAMKIDGNRCRIPITKWYDGNATDWSGVFQWPIPLIRPRRNRVRKQICEIMTLNPFEPPLQAEHSLERTLRPSSWWIAIAYLIPLLIVLTFMNEDGWYGTGSSGKFQGIFRIVAFFAGIGCAYYSIICGSKMQKLCVAPAVLGYTALMLGILWRVSDLVAF